MKNNDNIKKSLKLVIITAVLSVVVTSSFFIWNGRFRQPAINGHNHSAEDAKEQLYTCSMHPFIVVKEPGTCPVCRMDLVPKDKPAGNEEKKERIIAYWRAPMSPKEIYDSPGKSAMGMDLVPVYEDELINGVAISIDPVTRQNMGIRTAKAEYGPLSHTIRTYGHVTYDETRTTQINPRYSGWIEKLYVNFTGQHVQKDQPLFTLYSPELVTAQEEYLEAYRRSQDKNDYGKTLLGSVRRRLMNYNISEKEIGRIEKRGKPENTITIHSPVTGIVTSKNIIEGAFFKAGTNIYTVSDLSKIWVEVHIYEYELDRIKKGMAAEITLPYQPGKVYQGKVTYIYPYMQQKTRDIIVRLQFDNPGYQLKPGMFTTVKIMTTADKNGTFIPEEAVIRSGDKNIAFVLTGIGTFSPRNIIAGLSLDNGKIHILSGIAPGESVVTSGQFLLDSESKLKEAVSKMLNAEKSKKEIVPPPAESGNGFFDDM